MSLPFRNPLSVPAERITKGGVRMAHRSDRRLTKVRALIALGVVIGLLAAAYVLGRAYENRGAGMERGSLEGRFEQARTVGYDGASYRYRKRDLTTVLFMGIDRQDTVDRPTTRYRNGGQSDFLLLMVIDSRNKRVTPIHIDRDTMAEITVLGILGNDAGTTRSQICLSHGYGDGNEQSNRYAVEAVSKFLLGVDIDFYVSMNLESVGQLNDAVGGVTVTLEDDFSMVDPAMTVGTTLTLRDKQAEHFVRGRMLIGDGTNASRMRRQRVYMDELSHIIDEKTAARGAEFIGELFDLMEPNIQTNMKRGRMINEVWNARGYTREATVSPAGEHVIGNDGYVEFHADEDALVRLVLGLFFEPVS